MDKHNLEQVFQGRFQEAGDNWKGSCPFHDEKSPSFFVHKEQLIGHCFGCGVSGSIDILVSQYLSVSRAEAARRLDIELTDRLRAEASRSRKGAQGPRNGVESFPESWLAPFKKEVHKYVINRGFRTASLKAVGSLYDSSLQRQVFPHRDREGRLLGVVGRACKGQDPKWYFYWDYRKGQSLYMPVRSGGNGSKLSDRSTQADLGSPNGDDRLIIVEGIFDLLWLYQHGYTNVAAILGSKPTRSQLREIRDSTDEIILGLDNDFAGHEGTEILYRGLRRTNAVRFVQWPEEANDWMDLSGEQIDDVLRGTKNAVQERLAEHTHNT